ncbi:MAG: transcriptional regulator, NifA subfamily, Fis Family [Firmicutes bacterium]|nr:transcriptional regulator, NifA subfamily, Fis Family [Bacillota bacterium]
MNFSSISTQITNPSEQILAIASLFDHEFSIDLIQSISKAKATQILTVLDQYSKEGMLKKVDLGWFRFANENDKHKFRNLFSAEECKELHKQIANLLMNEMCDKDRAINDAAEQLLRVDNDLEGCQLLCKAGDYYRRIGNLDKEKIFYDKAISDLERIDGKEADLLFIKIMIGFSKDHMATSRPQMVISFLCEALKRAEKLNDRLLQSIVLLHLSSNQYLAGDYNNACSNYIKGRSIVEEANDPAIERILITSAVIHHTCTGQFREAIRTYEYFDSVFSKQPPPKRFSIKVELMLAISCTVTGHISQSLGLLERIRTEAHNSGDYVVEAHALANVGLVFIYIDDFENAVLKLNESLKLQTPNDIFVKYFAYELLAYCFYRMNDVKKSHHYLSRALKLRREYKYNPILYTVIFDICMAMEKGLYPSIPGLSFDDKLQDALGMENIYSQGVALRYHAIRLKQTNESPAIILQNLTQSLELLEKSGAQREIAETNIELSRYHLRLGNMSEAKKYITEAARGLYVFGKKSVPDDLKPLLSGLAFRKNITEELFKFGIEFNCLRDIKEIVRHILTTINRITGAERGGVFLKKENEKWLDLWVGKNLSASDLKKSEFAPAKEIIQKTFETGQGTVSSDILPDRQTAQNDGTFISSICVPLILKEKVIGVLYNDHRLFPSMFRKEDLQILTYFASMGALAIDNAKAYEEIKDLNKRLQDEDQYYERQQIKADHQEGFIAESPNIKQVLSSVKQVAQTESTALILGETGVGKELIARAIHQNSRRREKPFITVHCGAFPENLVAAELFGHEKGAFTGAIERRIGRFELANDGTLFLDEIGEISMDVQVRLLRVLQTKEFERLGGLKTIQSDFRLIAATNRNLEEDVSSGRFRADLFYRLNIFPVYVPPLRERVKDIEPLATYFLRKYSEKMGRSFKGIPKTEIDKLNSYHWPGNIRELKNVIERGVILSSGELFRVPGMIKDSETKPLAGQINLEEMERQFILQALQKTGWKIYGPNGAAEMLGLNHSTLYSRMKKLGIRKSSKTFSKPVTNPA